MHPDLGRDSASTPGFTRGFGLQPGGLVAGLACLCQLIRKQNVSDKKLNLVRCLIILASTRRALEEASTWVYMGVHWHRALLVALLIPLTSFISFLSSSLLDRIG
eukprot:1156383-Pelagomonas_calceolata.AAC.2